MKVEKDYEELLRLFILTIENTEIIIDNIESNILGALCGFI